MNETPSILYTCFHCCNETQHTEVTRRSARLLYEHIFGQRYIEDFEYYVYTCTTCGGLTLLGDFRHESPKEITDYPRLYPAGPSLMPPSHMLGIKDPIPAKVLEVYEEAWLLRQKNPNAFANQIRRALEFICEDRDAQGHNLARKLQDLAARGDFPSTVAELASQIRIVGNVGSHASREDLDIWDAQLLDDLFRIVLEYVYLAPSKLERIKQRTKRKAT
jgi:uncharacterized protein DUF4145